MAGKRGHFGKTYDTVPVKLADGALLKVLLGRRNVVALREVLDDLSTDPTTLEKLGLGVGEPPLQVWNRAGVGRLLAKVAWVINVNLVVRTSYSGCQSATKGRDRAEVRMCSPRIGPPLPSAEMGWPTSNWAPSSLRLTFCGTALTPAQRPRRPTSEVDSFMMGGKRKRGQYLQEGMA